MSDDIDIISLAIEIGIGLFFLAFFLKAAWGMLTS